MTTTEKDLTVRIPALARAPVRAPVLTITGGRRSFAPLKGVWEFRELLYFLAWRDVKIRYKQTVIGAAWAIIQPVVTMVIFTAIFHRFARINTGEIPYPVFAFAGLLPWNLFAGALQRSILSLVASQPLITKVYFPRVLVPVAATASAVVDFAVALVVLAVMAAYYGIWPTWRMLALPGAVGLILLASVGVGLWFSALNVRYRDVGHAIPFLIQVWMFASPVAYPVTLVPERWHLLYSLNPMVGAIQLFRWVLLGNPPPDPQLVALSVLIGMTLLAWGLFYFHRMERTFADVI